MLSCDVDGVLTDGRILVDDDGRETKAFFAPDGTGIGMLRRAGIVVAFISGSPSQSIVHRARRLGVEHVLLGSDDKLPRWQALIAGLGIAPENCAHIGDDLPDLPLLQRCGFAATVAHAPEALRRHAHYVATREPGRGAVREICELILAAQGRLDAELAAHGA
jgi:3-deoxy-D-manno-octulosonate 8-phosphate phosphatase (KDO 8-P phosphatase)